jgi:phosphohistidine phosphatase
VILYFLRHGDAGKPRPNDDDARQLSPSGEATLRAAAPIWRKLNLRPEVVISSPLPRALRTAELLIEGLGLKTAPTVDERLRPGARWAEMEDALAAYPDASSVMFVGHEPDLSSVMDLLTMGSFVGLGKGGLACVTFHRAAEPGAGKLAWLLDPDLYRTDADASS